MIRAHSVAAVRAAEQAAMADLPDDALMRRAAQGLAQVAAARLVERGGTSVVALVGSGDNGGDALYAVSLLSQSGFACAAALVTDTGRSGVHAAALAEAEGSAVTIVAEVDDAERAAEIVGGCDIVLDGIVGIGGRPGLQARASRLVDAVADDAWVIAVDLASGLDPAGEESADDTVWADETVTFATPKPVHLLPAGENATGRLTVVDIGVEPPDEPAAVERLTWDDVASLWPVPGPTDDKYSRGVLGVVAGGEAYTGAAVLAATAAAEAGVGMVRYIGTPTPTGLVRAAVPEAVMGEGRVQAWVIGPGLDVDATGDDAIAQLQAARDALESDLPLLADAGALPLVDGTRIAPTIITPHAGEAAILLSRLGDTDVSREQVEADPLRCARRLAKLAAATVLLKGATTLVVTADTDIPVRSQADAPAWLATAGAGDVLAGLVGTLLAAGLGTVDAGSLGALVHGVAADRVSRGGPLRALAVAHGIRPAVRDLLTCAAPAGA